MRPVTYTQTGTGSTPWVALGGNLTPAGISIACHVTGTVNYTVEYTYEDVNYSPNSRYAYVVDNPSVTVYPDNTVAGQTVDAVATALTPVWAARVTVNSGGGSVKATFVQAGIAGP